MPATKRRAAIVHGSGASKFSYYKGLSGTSWVDVIRALAAKKSAGASVASASVAASAPSSSAQSAVDESEYDAVADLRSTSGTKATKDFGKPIKSVTVLKVYGGCQSGEKTNPDPYIPGVTPPTPGGQWSKIGSDGRMGTRVSSWGGCSLRIGVMFEKDTSQTYRDAENTIRRAIANIKSCSVPYNATVPDSAVNLPQPESGSNDATQKAYQSWLLAVEELSEAREYGKSACSALVSTGSAGTSSDESTATGTTGTTTSGGASAGELGDPYASEEALADIYSAIESGAYGTVVQNPYGTPSTDAGEAAEPTFADRIKDKRVLIGGGVGIGILAALFLIRRKRGSRSRRSRRKR